jgi:hypothetical protein
MTWSGRTIAVLLVATALLPARSRCTEPAPGDAGLTASGYVFPSGRAQFRSWAVSALGPSAIAGDLVGASWRQWATDEPEEWDADGVGFARRFGTGSFSTFTSATFLSVGSAAMGQDAEYYRSPRAGLRPRLAHALVMTFAARDRDGDRVFSPAKTLAPYAGAVLTATTLYPDGYTWKDGVVSGSFGLLINAGWNAAQELIFKAPPWRTGREPAP